LTNLDPIDQTLSRDTLSNESGFAEARYDNLAIALHWSIAVLILIAFGLGLTVDSFPKAWEAGVVNTHAITGLGILILSFARLAWRFVHTPPKLPRDVGPFTLRVSGAVHWLLYALMLLVPLIGVPTLLFRGRGLDFGFFQIASPFSRTPDLFRPLTEFHELASYALIGVAAAHMLAALYHQFGRRDRLLLRMLPIPHR